MTSQPSDPVIGFKQGICKWAHSLIGQDLSEAVFCKTPYLWGFGFSLFRFLSLSLSIFLENFEGRPSIILEE